MSKKALSVYVDEAVIAALRDEALHTERTVSFLANRRLTDSLTADGYLIPTPEPAQEE